MAKADNDALISMAQQFSGLPMGSLIGGPLMAACQANQQMALTQVDFLMSTCFEQGTAKDKGSYTPIMIDLELTRAVITPGTSTPDIKPFTSTIKLPLLTIVPLNSLGVDSVSVDFQMQVSSSFSKDNSTDNKSNTHEEAEVDAKARLGLWSVEIKGHVSHDQSHEDASKSHYQKSNTATYKVNVHAGQLPLPTGVTTIIQAFAQNIAPITLPTPGDGSGSSN